MEVFWFFFCIINRKKFILTCWIENATTTVQDTYHAKLPLKFYRLLYCRCHIHIGSCHDFLPLTRHLLGKSRLTEKYKFPRCSYDIEVVFKVHSLCNDDISVKIWRQQLVNLVDENLFIMQNEGELSNDINRFKSHIIKIRWRSDSEWRLLGSYLYFSCCGAVVVGWQGGTVVQGLCCSLIVPGSWVLVLSVELLLHVLMWVSSGVLQKSLTIATESV